MLLIFSRIIAFEVDDVHKATQEVLQHGGTKVGEITSAEIEGVGLLTFIYLTDPEGNIIEIFSYALDVYV